MALEYKYSVHLDTKLKQEVLDEVHELFEERVKRRMVVIQGYEKIALIAECAFMLILLVCVLIAASLSDTTLLIEAIVGVVLTGFALWQTRKHLSGELGPVSGLAVKVVNKRHKTHVAADLVKKLNANHEYRISAGEKFTVKTPDTEVDYTPNEVKLLVKGKAAIVSENWKKTPRNAFLFFETAAQSHKVQTLVEDVGGEVVKL